MKNQRLAEEHHGVRFARAGGMPDNTTFPAPIRSASTDAFQQSFNTEHLLIAGDNFPGLFIKQSEEAGHLQQTFRRKQADEQFVLSTDSQFTGGD